MGALFVDVTPFSTAITVSTKKTVKRQSYRARIGKAAARRVRRYADFVFASCRPCSQVLSTTNSSAT